MGRSYLFTSESVTEGHPDKVADQISDAILDAFLSQDPYAHVACETLVTTGQVVVAGEVKARKGVVVDYPEVIREVIRKIGYDDPEIGFDFRSCGILVAIHQQSPDIDRGVSRGEEVGAGDQGMMFGYAVEETPTYMPQPIYFAHRLVERLAYLRKVEKVPFLRPDGKSQVTVRYEDGVPREVVAVVVSTQHTPDITQETLKEFVIEEVIHKVIPREYLSPRARFWINPTGRFVIGGPHGDTGLTGRKIIADTYGGAAPHGGGAFSGKDPTKVDRSAHYMARYVAKNLVASGVARKLLIQLAYAIGVVEPISVMVDSYGTGVLPDEEIASLVQELFPLTPRGMIDHLHLLRPIYSATAVYGHFGRELPEFSWEKTDMVEAIRRKVGKGIPSVERATS
jgi:S-adenosylmethionine synthetase